MNGLSEEQHISLIKKLVANARAIISNQVGFPVGCLKMSKILSWLKPYREIEIPVFDSYFAETVDIPTGTERLYCSRDAIKRYDEKLIALELEHREQVINACFEIINSYSKKKE
jgi:hypothetical protein